MDNEFLNNNPNPNYQSAFGEVPEQSPSAPPAERRRRSLLVPLIIFILLSVAGITFGVIELMKNNELKSEIEDLKSKISSPIEKPEDKPETPPAEKKYSGTSKFEFSSKSQGGIETPVDIPTIDYSIDLDFETGELTVKSVKQGNCEQETEETDNCGETEDVVVLTNKELGKIWWITQGNYEYVKISSAFATSNYTNGETFESILARIVKDDEILALKEELASSNWEEIADYDVNSDDKFSVREYANKIFDDILFEIYGYANCPSKAETNCEGELDNCKSPVTDCNGGPEGTDCGTGEIMPYIDCESAKEIGYPFITVVNDD